MKEMVKAFMKAVMILLITISLAIGLGFYIGTKYMEKDAELYNNGICTECGGHYTFSAMTKSHPNSDIIYSYTCDVCGHTILTHRIMK